ncbi:unnamed protein product [Prorocentrum cordatum]|uniref:Cytochrome c oxidase subunit 1 n=1 Tax=Prorocentrum cordatum TaxID=2364126 RepID=A0ABN9TUB8_9DINO|nr:unnamed protein product [Polarella glacialis]
MAIPSTPSQHTNVTCGTSCSRSTRWASAAATSSRRSRTSSIGVVCLLGFMMVLDLRAPRCPHEQSYDTELALFLRLHVTLTLPLSPMPMVSLTIFCMTHATFLEPPLAVLPVAMPRLKLYAMVLHRFHTFFNMELGLFLGVVLALLNLLCVPLPPVVSVLVTLVMLSMLFGPLCMPLPLVAPVFVMYLSCVPLPLVAPVFVMLAMPSLLSAPSSANGIGPHGARRCSRTGRSSAASATRGSTVRSAPACSRSATRPSRIPLHMMMLPLVVNQSTTTPPCAANNLFSQHILSIALPILMLPRAALDPYTMYMPMLPLVVYQGTMSLTLVPNGLFSQLFLALDLSIMMLPRVAPDPYMLNRQVLPMVANKCTMTLTTPLLLPLSFPMEPSMTGQLLACRSFDARTFCSYTAAVRLSLAV